MGVVWIATDTRLGRDVAIKLLPESFATDPERVARFEREARALASLNHPNIVTIHGVEHDGTTPFLVMEYVRGATLAKRIPPDGLGAKQLFEFAVPLAEAIAEAHRQGVTHRDLKPGNVVVTDDGRPKILDFGLAKLIAADAAQGGLWVYPLDGSPRREVFVSDDSDVRVDYPEWAPDGRWVVFDRVAPRGGDIWLLEWLR